MRQNTLAYIGIGSFLSCWVIFLAMPCPDRDCVLFFLTDLSESVSGNYILLVFFFAGVSLFLTLLVDFSYHFIRRFKPFRPRLGEILVRSGHISKEDLKAALAMQRLRLGELLLYLDCLSRSQLEEALSLQATEPDKRLGEILEEKGFVTESDIEAAGARVHAKLGKILMEQGLIDRRELHTLLGKQWYGRNHGL